jgi:hypothetical protein
VNGEGGISGAARRIVDRIDPNDAMIRVGVVSMRPPNVCSLSITTSKARLE